MTDAAADARQNYDEEQKAALQEAASLLTSAFPDIKCLRCGYDSFAISASQVFTGRIGREHRIGPIHFNPYPPTVALICQRCGMTENHAIEYLQKAEKPIPRSRDV